MSATWYAGNFCPKGSTCSLEEGELTPSNGPKIRTVDSIDLSRPYAGIVQQFDKAPPQSDNIHWYACSGQVIAIQENINLFSTLGTLYGGDGRMDFGLPNLITDSEQTTNYYICSNGDFATHF